MTIDKFIRDSGRVIYSTQGYDLDTEVDKHSIINSPSIFGELDK